MCFILFAGSSFPSEELFASQNGSRKSSSFAQPGDLGSEAVKGLTAKLE